MNREILFRGKRLGTDKWAYGYYYHAADDRPDRRGDWIQTVTKHGNTGLLRKVTPETVGQYTGLDDMNDVKIFEGDVIRDNESGAVASVYYDEQLAAYTICIREHLFYLNSLDCRDLEVIGNVYDNPELLEGEL